MIKTNLIDSAKEDKIISILNTIPFFSPTISYKIQYSKNSVFITLTLRSGLTVSEFENIMNALKQCGYIYNIDFRRHKLIFFLFL